MELILWLLVSYYLANNLVTNTAYAVRGLDPPRHKERMARIENGGQAPAGAYQSGRHGASRFFAEAWHDAWDDAHGKRQALREKRHAKNAERAEGTPEAQPDGSVDALGALRPQEQGEAGENVIPLASRRAAARSGAVVAAAGATRTASASTTGSAPRGGGTATAAPPRPAGQANTPDPSSTAARPSASSDDADWDDWREPTHCEHCPADDGPGGTVRLRLDVTPSGDLCDECYGRRRAAEVDPDGPTNQPVTCPKCGEDRRRYDLDRVSLYGGEPELACPDCIQLAAVKRPRRFSDPDPTAESADWPDTAPANPARPEPSAQPDGLLDSPSALRPAGNEPDPEPNPQQSTTRASSGDPYPSLFTTAAAWEAHQATLTPEVRRDYDALCARAVAADGALIPITVAEQAALLQARGYAPNVAQQAAEDIHARARREGGAVMMGGFRRLAGEDADRWTPGQHEQPTGTPAADRDGTAASQETQEGNRMSVMTSNNATGQPTGETAGLGSAIRFAEGMAGSMRDAASRTETSVASLTGSEVGAGPIAALQQAMEAATNAAAAFEHARAELEKQLTVKEAYDATPDAGNRQFLQSD